MHRRAPPRIEREYWMGALIQEAEAEEMAWRVVGDGWRARPGWSNYSAGAFKVARLAEFG